MLAKAPVSPPRFSISTLDVEEEHIFLTLMDGGECVGRMLLTPAGKQRFERFEGGRRYTKIPYQFVSLWRPINVREWPFELPLATATLTPELERPRAAPKRVQGGDLEDAPCEVAGFYLGRPDEPPESVSEVEVRLLRCIRTRNVLDRERNIVETLWLKPWQDAIKALNETLQAIKRHHGRIDIPTWRKEDYDDYHVDGSELEARPARFTPTHRDVSEYEAAIDIKWLDIVWKKDRHLFLARAELPPVQWWALADAERLDESAIKGRYRDALERLFQKVKAR